MKKILICTITILLLLACKSKQHFCNKKNFKALEVTGVNCILKIPDYIVTDTVRYGGQNILFENKVMSVDSLFTLYAGVESYEINPDALESISHRMESQKIKIQSGQPPMQLLVEEYKNFDTIKVGYLKYLDTTRKRYEGRIFFNKGLKFADIWLFEKYSDDKNNRNSLMDCVWEELQLK